MKKSDIQTNVLSLHKRYCMYEMSEFCRGTQHHEISKCTHAHIHGASAFLVLDGLSNSDKTCHYADIIPGMFK